MTWWFPVVGRASYRGYFHEPPARRYADAFAKKGWDVYVDGIQTYSTLGWFDDPVLNTFINEPDSYLAEIIFHELTHRRLFVPGDTDFNEAFATAVASEGVRRWLLASSSPQALDQYRAALAKDHQFVDLVMDARAQLQALYDTTNLSDTVKLSRKQDIIVQLRARHSDLKASWGGQSPYDDWFAEPINNAKLNTVSAYYDLVPAFDALLSTNGGDLEKFYHAVARLAKLPLPQRHRQLQAYLATPSRQPDSTEGASIKGRAGSPLPAGRKWWDLRSLKPSPDGGQGTDRPTIRPPFLPTSPLNFPPFPAHSSHAICFYRAGLRRARQH